MSNVYSLDMAVHSLQKSNFSIGTWGWAVYLAARSQWFQGRHHGVEQGSGKTEDVDEQCPIFFNVYDLDYSESNKSKLTAIKITFNPNEPGDQAIQYTDTDNNKSGPTNEICWENSSGVQASWNSNWRSVGTGQQGGLWVVGKTTNPVLGTPENSINSSISYTTNSVDTYSVTVELTVVDGQNNPKTFKLDPDMDIEGAG